MSGQEPPFDEAELAEATRFALDLEGRGASSSPEIEAAEVVGLLRAPALTEARATAVQEQVERAIRDARRRRRVRQVATLGAGGLAMAAAALLLIVRRAPDVETAAVRSPTATTATVPDAIGPGGNTPVAAYALEAAQLAWLEAPTASHTAALDHALSAYRAAVFAELDARYAR